MARKARKPVPLKQKALDLLSRRRLSRGELRFKLLIRGYSEIEIDRLLDHYGEIGYLDDSLLAYDYARQRLAVNPMGRKLLMLELLRRKLPTELAQNVVEEVFTEFSEEERAEAACKILVKKTDNKAKIWNKMVRLGFPYDLIESAVARNEPEGGYE